MAEFRCVTQKMGVTLFVAPRGKYLSRRGAWFVVNDKVDAEFFRKKVSRFEEKGVARRLVEKVVAPKPVVEESAEVTLRKWAEEIKGVSKKAAEKIAFAYNTKEDVIADLERGLLLNCEISGRAQKAVRDELGFDVDGHKIPDEEDD